MVDYHSQFPQYGFAEHKGYGRHLIARQYANTGACPLHGNQFRGVLPESEDIDMLF